MYPFLLRSAIKDYIWGGQKLKTDFGKISDYDIIAESWELSCHQDGMSIIENGELKGRTLYDYVNTDRTYLLGCNCDKFDIFPILAKLIDARNDLSIQVHPNNEYAQIHENQFGKTEMWYIVDCEPNSYIYYGFNRDITIGEFRERIKNNTFLETLNKVYVQKGDAFYIEAGTIHAICSGIVIAEIQQNSNVTYRVYDYNRLGDDGKPRQLHVDKAADVINYKKQEAKTISQHFLAKCEDFSEQLLAKCEYFNTTYINLHNFYNSTTDEKSFHCFLCLDGNSTLHTNSHSIPFRKGQTIFIPANLGNYQIIGDSELLKITA